MRVLVIEDAAEAAAYVVKGLTESGHVVDRAHDGEDGLTLARLSDYDVLVVDRMLPKRDGLALVAQLRAEGNVTPVLFLSALGAVDDRVRGLRAGGDDYLVKPFAFAELLARIEAVARRRDAAAVQTRLRVADLELDLLSRRAERAGVSLDLQPREYTLLECLMRNAGRVFTRHDAAGARVGLPFRPQDQRRRRPYQPSARQDRQGLRPAVAPYGPGRRILSP